MKNYLRVISFCGNIRAELIAKVLMSLLVTGTYVAQAILLARGTASVFARAPFKAAALCYLGAAGLILLRALLNLCLEGFSKQTAGKVKAAIREILINKLLLLGPAYQNDKRSGKLQSLLTDGVEYLEPFLVNYIPQIFIVVFSVVPMTVYIFSVSIPAGSMLTLAVALAILIPPLLMPVTKKSSLGYWREYAVLNSQYVDTMQGMNTLKAFYAQDARGQELAADSERFRERQITNTAHLLFSSAAITLMMGVATSLTTGVAAYACSDGKLGYAALLNIMFLVIECVRPIGVLNDAWHSSYLGLSVCNEFAALMDEPIVIQNPESPDAVSIDGGLPRVSFDHVSFRYREDRELALSDVSFEISPGQTVAFAGESGSGKSTLVNLLLRFYDPKDGCVRINGVDIREYDVDYLRSRVAVVFQNTFLFYGTVLDNLRVARPGASMDEVVAAAKAAGAHDFIVRLERGYDTLVGERGATLSGGQRQRISIARAILKRAPLLLMDEATSSVDAATEHMIQQTVEGIQGQYTTLLIAHRLSTIRRADRIFVLNGGRLVEQGSHDELLEQNGYYSALIEAQRADKPVGEAERYA